MFREFVLHFNVVDSFFRISCGACLKLLPQLFSLPYVHVHPRRHGEAGGLPVLSDAFVRNGMHIGGRVVHRRNGQFLVAFSRQRAMFNVQLTLVMLRQARPRVSLPGLVGFYCTCRI